MLKIFFSPPIICNHSNFFTGAMGVLGRAGGNGGLLPPFAGQNIVCFWTFLYKKTTFLVFIGKQYVFALP
jgi:hypothetical protein